MKELNVLHIASFTGNIGDNANHMGFRPWFEANLGKNIKWSNLEIREFYWKERVWDAELVDYINSFDLLVIGGGNYFELWVETSPTGTSIAIEPDLFKKIDVPVFFNALGVDPGQGVPESSLKKFQTFMDILNAPQYLVTVRNDGALKNMKQYVGELYADIVHSIPDGGFFVSEFHSFDNKVVEDSKTIVINIASDMPEVRFKNFPKGELDFATEIAISINDLSIALPDVKFVLVPHIFRDLEIITQVIERVSDRLRRTRIKVAAYDHGDNATLEALSVYATADLVLGMRFHSNVCAMSLEKPVLGLCSYPQIFNLYEELDLNEMTIDISDLGFSGKLVEQSQAILSNKSLVDPSVAIERTKNIRKLFEPTLKNWFAKNSLS